MNKTFTAASIAALVAFSGATRAEQCASVTLADPGWSDIAATNATAGLLLEGLGYTSTVQTLGVPIIFGGLRDGQVDVFLGNWMPAQQGYHEKFVASGEVDELGKNLEGTEFTLAVPTYVYESGVHDFADLAARGDDFGKRIYGIGAGAPANQSLQKIIDEKRFDLGDWKLVESSEQAMLAEVGRATRREKPIVFLGWTPHPMNVDYDIRYLSGGEEWFGSAGTVHTLARKGFAQSCPNLGKLFSNLSFTLDMENALMATAAQNGGDYRAAAKGWLKEHPQVLDGWLEGVTSKDGGEASAAVKKLL